MSEEKADQEQQETEEHASEEEIMSGATEEDLRAEIRAKRDSEGKYRTERNELREQLKELQGFKSKVQSVFGEDEGEDPEKKIQQLQQENEELKKVRAIDTISKKYDGDTELLTALYRNSNFSNEKELEEAIKEKIDSNPKYKNNSVSKFGSGDDSGKTDQKRKMTLNDIIRKKAGL